MSRPPDLGAGPAVQSFGIFLAAWTLGRLTGARRAALLALVVAAEQRAAVERELAAAERDRTMLTQVEERLRIARDVHDVLAHSISVVSVQATVGAHLAADDPDAARRALPTIGDVSHSSMGELRQMLALLRDESATGSDDGVSYEPARGRKGRGVVGGDLPVGGSTGAELDEPVGMTHDLDALQVVVSDNGRGATTTTGGHGLVGMRERTSLLGGRLEIGPAADSGFTVTATIPFETPDPERA